MRLIVGSLGVACLVAVAFLLLWYPRTGQPIKVFWTALTLPTELRSTDFVAQTSTGMVIYRATWHGFTPIRTIASPVTSVEREGDVVYTTVRTSSGTNIMRNDTVVASLPGGAATIAVSPDEKRIAYSTDATGTPRGPSASAVFLGSTPAPSSPNREIETYYPASHRSLVSGPGTGPVYIDNTHLFRLIPSAYLVSDLTDPTHTVFAQAAHMPVSTSVHSPDRTIVAWREVPNTVVIYRVRPNGLEKVNELEHLTAFTLGNTALYEIRTVQAGSSSRTEIWKRPLVGTNTGVRIATLPYSLHITSILP
jgi:hypothetical protein